MTTNTTNSNLVYDTSKTYKVTANVFSMNVETYNGTANDTTALGPIGFDCYEVVTAASNANFNNSITFEQYNGSSTPSWMAFDTTTANISISNTSEISSDTYKITNSYTGVINASFTLETTAIISLAEYVAPPPPPSTPLHPLQHLQRLHPLQIVGTAQTVGTALEIARKTMSTA